MMIAQSWNFGMKMKKIKVKWQKKTTEDRSGNMIHKT